MSFLQRFVIDLVTEDEMSQRRRDTIAEDLSEHAHLLSTEPEDGVVNVLDKLAQGHEHDATVNRCADCTYHARDARNGDVVASG
jgi:hypothetical protein